MNEEEIREAMAQLKEQHIEEQDDLDFRQDNEIADIQYKCSHSWSEPKLESFDYADFIIRTCNICSLSECAPFGDSEVKWDAINAINPNEYD